MLNKDSGLNIFDQGKKHQKMFHLVIYLFQE